MMEFESEYQRMRQRFLRVREPGAEEYSSAPAVPERLVRCIWYDGLYMAEALRTESGERVEVLSQGEWNLTDGPDFLGAVVRVGDGAPARGDVEIHVRSGDWRRHGHHLNPRYDSVVLHVTLRRDTPETSAARSDGSAAPQVCLIHALAEDIRDLADRIDMENYPFSSESRVGGCRAVAETGPDSVDRLLRMAGRERLFSKARRYGRELAVFNEDEVIYRGFMEALGYRPNKRPFRKLADLAPLKQLRPALLATPPERRAVAL